MESSEDSFLEERFFSLLFNSSWGVGPGARGCVTLPHSRSKTVGYLSGVMEHHKEIVEYINERGVSAIFLLRRNVLRRMVSMLANSYDRYAKLINGTHKSHVHSPEEANTLSSYKPSVNSASLITDLKQMELIAVKALEYFRSTRHITLYYEDLLKNRTILQDVQNFLRLPQMDLTSRQVKIHKGPLSEQIKNWEDIKDTLRGTAYESYLSADY
ncbi:hypothetical protein RJ639_023687 [Escallonia herrerae]|uniref:Sulfotransferase n=1 Tax=Escallonia herrerae TaxID=1293975 RepID=A0AA88V1I9_9ASTE|nr:hypothetical protein RJ639_023687 [Escallonia herrerae]